MDIYFVRHGQTDGNVAKRHQHANTPLNEVGQRQAEVAAWEISEIKPTHIISSTQLRAVQTTKIIADYCEDVIPDTHPAFEELRRPKAMVGNRYVGISTFFYVTTWFFGAKHADGESYADVIARIKEARSHIESLPSDSRVVVVSHAVFTNIFLEHLCSDEPMSLWRAFKRFWQIFTMRNATIIHLKCHAAAPGICRWQYVSSMRVYQKK